jgi:hypothetical protein
MSEASIYHTGNILITTTLARFGKTSYPIASIGSVRVDSPDRRGAIVGCIVAAVIALVALGQASGWAVLAGLVAVGLLARVFTLPHKLMLRTASGDQQAYESTKLDDVEAVKAAIEKAVTLRG